MENITSEQRNALQIVLEFVERYNKNDEEKLVAESAQILEDILKQ